jgi:hypothetical protein
MNNTINGHIEFPWEKRIEKAFFRGVPTGANHDFFPAYWHDRKNCFPSPEETRDIILENPNAWSRAYLAHFAFYHQDLVNAKLVVADYYESDVYLQKLRPPIQDQTLRNAEHGQTFIDFGELVDYYLLPLPHEIGWRRLVCPFDNYLEFPKFIRPKLLDRVESGEIVSVLADLAKSEHFWFIFMQVLIQPLRRQIVFCQTCLEILLFYVFDYNSSRGYKAVFQELKNYACERNWVD